MDPLAQLKDIHVPEQIHNYPLAIGWWILAVLIIIILVSSVIKYRKFKALRKNKRLALAQLNNTSNGEETLKLIKWVALQYFPRAQVAPLYGESLLGFMQQALPENKQQAFDEIVSNNNLNSAFENIYQQQVLEGDAIHQVAEYWLNQALPPKPITTDTKEMPVIAREAVHD